MPIAQKWLTGLIGLGALYLVVANPAGFYKGALGIQKITGGTIATITSGGKR